MEGEQTVQATEATTKGNSTATGKIDVTPEQDGGVLKEILQQGVGDDGPLSGDEVSVHYVGTLASDGSKFDSSRDRGEEFKFKIGTGTVIKAWDLGVATMKRGEKCRLECEHEYAYGVHGSPPKIPSKAKLIFEIELFDWKGEDVSEEHDGGVLKSILEKGSDFKKPKDGVQVKIHLIGKHKGHVFEDRDVDFELGDGERVGVVEGVEMALNKMQKEEKAFLKIKPKYAYNTSEHKAGDYVIPPNSDLTYEVTLKDFEAVKESWEMNADEKLEEAKKVKEKGNQYFKAQNYKPAIASYKKVSDYLEYETDMEDDEEKLKLRKELLVASHNNLALIYLKREEFVEARHECDKALKLDDRNLKSLLRRGKAQFNTRDYKEAIEDLEKVLKEDPNDKEAKRLLYNSNVKLKEEKQADKKLFKGMFDKFAAEDEKKKAAKQAKQGDAFGNVEAWNNELAEGMMPLEQEMAAFGETAPQIHSLGREANKENNPQEN